MGEQDTIQQYNVPETHSANFALQTILGKTHKKYYENGRTTVL